MHNGITRTPEFLRVTAGSWFRVLVARTNPPPFAPLCSTWVAALPAGREDARSIRPKNRMRIVPGAQPISWLPTIPGRGYSRIGWRSLRLSKTAEKFRGLML